MRLLSEKRYIKRLIEADIGLCHLFNRASLHPHWQRLFTQVSLLGNGRIWYILMGALVLFDSWDGAYVALQMACVGIASLLLYWLLKRLFARERPFIHHPGIVLGTAPLDRFSFPSGHTLHAIAFTLIMGHYYPSLLLALLPLTLLIALSRLVLGLHYPSDVIVGGTLGALLAILSFNWF